MDKVIRVAAYAVETIHGASSVILKGESHRKLYYHFQLLEVALQDLEQISYSEIENIRAAHAWLNLKRSVVLAKRAIRNGLDSSQSDHPKVDAQVHLWGPSAERDYEDLSLGVFEFSSRYPFLLGGIYRTSMPAD